MTAIAIILMVAALVCAFVWRPWGAVIAWCSLLVASIASPGLLGWQGLTFWGVAVILVVVTSLLDNGTQRRPSRQEILYVTLGALAGAVVGLIISAAGLVVGSAVGAFFGAMAWSRTPGGVSGRLPGRRGLIRFAGIALQAVVTMSVAGLALAIFLQP